MDGRNYAAQSDPAKNPQFRRSWTGPPDRRRERRPAGNGTALGYSGNVSSGQIRVWHAPTQAPASSPWWRPFGGVP
jgi:hypothetical protein